MNRINYIISCFFFLVSSLTSFSQVGSIKYSHTFYGNSSESVDAQHNLYFNSGASVFYMKSLTANMPVEKEKSAPLDDDHEVMNVSLVNNKGANVYYRDLKTRKLMCRASALNKKLKSKMYLFEDEGAERLDWVLREEFKNISGYYCQKATVLFRGRNYDAWFTTEIPLPYGPWKLGGLPGLILEVYDDRKEISFTAENITIPDPDTKKYIVMPEGMPISHKDYASLRGTTLQRIRQARLPQLFKEGKIISSSRARKDIELDYEWSEE